MRLSAYLYLRAFVRGVGYEDMLHTLNNLKPYRESIVLKPLASEIRSAWLTMRKSPHWAPLSQQVSSAVKVITKACAVSVSGDAVRFDLPDSSLPRGFDNLLKKLLPWRIGPYRIGDTTIDSEWRSPIKWRRLEPILGDLTGLKVADVGSNSGYFLFKIAHRNPEIAIGFDPIERCWLQFGLLQGLAKLPNLAFVPTGLSTVDSFPGFFDLVLCMGVIYHQRDPFTACKKLFAATKPGGRVILESMVIPGPGSHMLIPQERYAKMRNAWIIPTAEALSNLLTRAGFCEPEIHHFGPVTTAEQRRTEWAPYESLADFLDAKDQSLTVEGYPAPHSALVVARRAR
jgi:tRNA (mo5U34)-methyltransferase